MPTFTVVAGANGSGKTTLTKWAREEFQESSVLDPDAIARSLQATGTNSGSAIDAGREVLSMAERLLDGRQSFTVETTLSGNTYLRMMKRAKDLGYLVVFMYVGTTGVEINMQRVRFRVTRGGHDVPREINAAGIPGVSQMRRKHWRLQMRRSFSTIQGRGM
jgi:predicted ABC-type ATPase